MEPVNPKLVEGYERVIYAENQEEFSPLPAIISTDGICVTEWKFTPEEIELIKNNGKLRLSIMTMGRSLQPVLLEVIENESLSS